MERKLKLSPPWDGHMSMLASFFAGDSRIKVGYCEKGVGTVEVFDTKTYVALQQILRQKVKFGNVALEIRIVPANGIKTVVNGKMSDIEALKVVLAKNPAFSKIKSQKDGAFSFIFCLFKPLVIQWYNDNLGNPWKLSTSTFEEQADKVFKTELGVQFTTEPPKGAKFRKGKRG